MRGLEIPPREDDFTADPVELFFDLSYVFAFSQLVARLVDDPTPPGVARTLLLFVLVWIPWTQFHWSANAVSGNSPSVRVWFLVATVASIPMGASVVTAYGSGGPVFALSSAVILGMGLLTMIVGLDRDSPVAASIRSYATPNWAAMVVIVVAAFLPDPVRTWGWIAGVLVVLVFGMLRAGGREWIVRSGHFAERHGLIVIIALGEVVVATALGVADAVGVRGASVPDARTLATLAGSGVFAGVLWWSYFDRPIVAWEHGADQVDGPARGRFARDVWSLWHVPIVAGIILVAAALEEVTLHPGEPLPGEFRVLLVLGITGFQGGIVGGVWRAFRVVGWERLVAVGVAGSAILVLPTSGLVLLAVLDLLGLAMLVVERRRADDEVAAAVPRRA